MSEASSPSDEEWQQQTSDSTETNGSSVEYVSDELVEEIQNRDHVEMPKRSICFDTDFYDPMYTFKLGDELLRHGILPSEEMCKSSSKFIFCCTYSVSSLGGVNG